MRDKNGNFRLNLQFNHNKDAVHFRAANILELFKPRKKSELICTALCFYADHHPEIEEEIEPGTIIELGSEFISKEYVQSIVVEMVENGTLKVTQSKNTNIVEDQDPSEGAIALQGLKMFNK